MACTKAYGGAFGVEVPAISKHLKNIFESGELFENSVVSKMETTELDGKNYITAFYNLDGIIAVEYRVNSYQATSLGYGLQKHSGSLLLKDLCSMLSG